MSVSLKDKNQSMVTALLESRASWQLWQESSYAQTIEEYDFSDVEFNQPLNLINYTFTKPVYFNKTIFKGYVVFENVVFDDVVNFSEAQFLGYLNCKNTNFSHIVDFANCTFGGFANFTFSTFKEIVRFNYSIFKQGLGYDNSIFYDDITCEKIEVHHNFFSKNTKFIKNFCCDNSTVSGQIIFTDSIFEQLACFKNSILEDVIYLERSHFKQYPPDFRSCTIKTHIKFNNIIINSPFYFIQYVGRFLLRYIFMRNNIIVSKQASNFDLIQIYKNLSILAIQSNSLYYKLKFRGMRHKRILYTISYWFIPINWFYIFYYLISKSGQSLIQLSSLLFISIVYCALIYNGMGESMVTSLNRSFSAGLPYIPLIDTVFQFIVNITLFSSKLPILENMQYSFDIWYTSVSNYFIHGFHLVQKDSLVHQVTKTMTTVIHNITHLFMNFDKLKTIDKIEVYQHILSYTFLICILDVLRNKIKIRKQKKIEKFVIKKKKYT